MACCRRRAQGGAAVVEIDGSPTLAFDLIEHDGEDLRPRPFLERKAALAGLLRDTEPASCLTNTLPRMAPPSLRTLASLARRVSFPRRWTAPTGPACAASGSRSAILPALRCSVRGARCGIEEPQAMCADDDPAVRARKVDWVREGPPIAGPALQYRTSSDPRGRSGQGGLSRSRLG
jgi:hypothetical protein